MLACSNRIASDSSLPQNLYLQHSLFVAVATLLLLIAFLGARIEATPLTLTLREKAFTRSDI